MKTSQYPLYTIKETPKKIDIISHKLMLKSGLIRQSSSGLYIWLPNGLKVLNNIKKIIRYEINKLNAIEMSFPLLQPKYLWEKSNRFQEYGKELMKIYDRNNNIFILSPTYEEMITQFITQEITSYKKLPIIIYQIQKKFRDEIRPRSGTMRAREFIMKDAYSFHINEHSLEKTYQIIYDAYKKIFNVLNLKFYSVQANSGLIGGKYSHEFQSPSNNGEDQIMISYYKKKNSKNNSYEIKKTVKKKILPNKIININKILKKYNYNIKNIFFQMKKKIIKIFIININHKKNKYFAFMIRGDHELNINKIKNCQPEIIKKNQILFSEKKKIKNILKKTKEVNLSIPIIIDTHISYLDSILPIVLINNIYFHQYSLQQNFKKKKIYDIINYDESKYRYKIKNCIEIGHIFKIGTKYSKNTDSSITNKKGNKKLIHMGCYGIGVTRLINAIIEQNHDKKGIIWPNHIAPFEVLIIPINLYQCKKIQKISTKIYLQFKNKNIKVLMDDRDERIGVIFSDANLIGIPNIIIINKNTVYQNTVEYQERKNIQKKITIHIDNIIQFILNKKKSKH
ncbi:proline--tRNA ligase [Buchnera aphidicola]|uniref:proline--tRNA ligase n=1 Tax=Buchnera aphidicola TaxID=9 RepID=UPI003463E761